MKIEEAVEIVRDGVAEPMKKVGFDLPALQEICRRHSEAMEVLAKEYVAQHREDDGELVPFRESECGQYSVFIGLDGAYVLRIGKGNTLLLHAEYKTQPTMGQLRHLIRGLGGEA